MSVVVLTATMSLTACSTNAGTVPAGGGGAATTEHTDDISAGVQPDPAAVALLPAEVKAKGTLVTAEDLTSPPTTFMASDNKTPIGFNPDIARLIAAKLGLKLDIKNVKFDVIIPGLQGNRYDLTVSTMGTSAERLKVLDMINYFTNGSTVATAAGNPKHLAMDSLCGATLGVQSGSTQELKWLPKLNQQNCVSKGKDPIKAVALPSVSDALTQVASRRIDGVFYDATSLTWAKAKQPNAFDVLQPVLNPLPVAVALNLNSPLTPAVQAALQSIIDSPKYQEALSRWGFTGLGVTKAERSKPQPK
ncbi:amino acid ABC transporter substrate-binding protein [Amycolatopsis vastitatis]|uniref:Amino acid ABC transporter substrate-binding protein n=2 Tax=Amycolatopsis vastitatis TaxID=1905142 RepID=A0A229T4Z0_9PSEU|nr:amino acid ABC transporter substrate-binding protein [Amycolatopsis vastitatis]